MNKKTTVLAVIGVGVVILGAGGYFASRLLAGKIAENVMEKAIESQTGAKVDINTDSENGGVTVKSADGQVQYSAGGNVTIPANLPAELIVVTDAKPIMATSSDTGVSLSYLTDTDQAGVVQKYLTDLPQQGWTKETEIDSGQGKMVNFTKDNQSVVVTVQDNTSEDPSSQTEVSLVWQSE